MWAITRVRRNLHLGKEMQIITVSDVFTAYVKSPPGNSVLDANSLVTILIAFVMTVLASENGWEHAVLLKRPIKGRGN